MRCRTIGWLRRGTRAIWLVMCLVATAAMGPVKVSAADGEPAVTRLADVDEDFHFMGEYAGTLSGRVPGFAGDVVPFGLQVIPLGDQRFSAVLLPGGLPGNGSEGRQRLLLEGQRTGPTLTLANDQLRLVVEAGKTRVVESKEGWRGDLQHVQRTSRRAGAPAPPDAYILYDGSGPGAFKDARIVDGLLQSGTELLPLHRDYLLHVEFLVPYMPRSDSQARGNSGVYLQSRYEVQILDTFGREGLANECGGLYKQRAPRLNMAFPPLSWQTYDITFRSPSFDSQGNKVRNARITLLHNGIKVHDHVEITAKTGAGQPEAPHLLPTKLQDHGNPVQFRNVWLLDLR